MLVAKKRGVQEALLVVDAMKMRGIKPNEVTYGAIIASCRRSGDVAGALSILDQMDAERIEPDVVGYTCILGACGKKGDFETGKHTKSCLLLLPFFPLSLSFSLSDKVCFA